MAADVQKRKQLVCTITIQRIETLFKETCEKQFLLPSGIYVLCLVKKT